jgi:hypothetical protein
MSIVLRAFGVSKAPRKTTFPSAHFGKKSTMYSPRRGSPSFAGARFSFLAGCAPTPSPIAISRRFLDLG